MKGLSRDVEEAPKRKRFTHLLLLVLLVLGFTIGLIIRTDTEWLVALSLAIPWALVTVVLTAALQRYFPKLGKRSDT